MPDQDQIDRIVEKHGGKTSRGADRKRADAEPKPPDRNLDDAAEQARIMDPEPNALTFVNGYKIKLHEPSLAVRKRAFGFLMGVASDGASLPGINKGLLPARIVQLLNQREDFEHGLSFWAGKLFGPAGTISDEQAEEFATEIMANSGPRDLAPLFQLLCELVGVDLSKN